MFEVATPLGSPLPCGWALRPLGSMCTKIGSGATPRGGSAVYRDNGITFIRSQNVFDHHFSDKGLAFIDDLAAEKLSGVAVQHGDVLLNITGDGDTIARCCIVPDRVLPARVNQHVLIIRTRGDNLLPAYLQRYLSHPKIRKYMLSHNSGGSRRALTKGHAEGFEIVVPPLPTQHAIAEVLSALDDKIECNATLRRSLRSFGQALFEQAMGSAAIEMSVGELTVSLARGVAPRYTTPGLGAIVLNQKCIRDGWVLTEAARWMEDLPVKNSQRAHTGDIVVNSTGVGTLGRVARWLGTKPVIVDGHITVVRPDSSQYPSTVFGYAMLAAQPQIEALGEGSTGQTELSRGRLQGMQVRLPSLAGANRITESLQELDEHAEALLNETRILGRLRNTLLPPLLSGELHVRDAEALLGESV